MNCKIESGVQLFSRVTSKSSLETINRKLFPEGLPTNSYIEITGPDINQKYQLLLDFLVRCILPSAYCEEWMDCAVIFVNTDQQIGMFDILNSIDGHLKKKNVKTSSQIVAKALKNITLVNCFNCDEFELSLCNLERIVNSYDNHDLVLIDNIAPFYWNKRFSSDKLSLYSVALDNFEILYNVTKSLNLVLIFIRNETVESKKKFSSKIDYKIYVDIESGNNFKAIVTNYVKGNEQDVTYKYENILIF